MAIVDVNLRLDDLGLFRKRMKGETSSQYERAVIVRNAFAHCMHEHLRNHHCVMPYYCAHGSELSCCHLQVDYMDFIGRGPSGRNLPLPIDRQVKIDSRLRGIGTLVYREVDKYNGPPLPGDIHIPSLKRVAQFTGKRKAPVAAPAPATPARSGFFERLFGL